MKTVAYRDSYKHKYLSNMPSLRFHRASSAEGCTLEDSNQTEWVRRLMFAQAMILQLIQQNNSKKILSTALDWLNHKTVSIWIHKI